MATYSELVGERLRSIRRQRGFSLQDVQRMSAGEFKAAVLGAYERGERSLSIPRLRRLAEFYEVPVVQLLPPEPSQRPPIGQSEPAVTIDLNRLERLAGPEAAMVERFLRGIQMQRQDFNGRVLTVRRDDLRLLTMLLDEPEGRFAKAIGELAADGA